MSAEQGNVQPWRERILPRISVGGFDACWWWLGAPNSKGYGTIRVDGRTRRAHRVVYEYLRGPIPDDHLLHHTCENKLCVNPRHLDPVLPLAHMEAHDFKASKVISARWKLVTHCKLGHEFTPENTRINKRRKVCRICERAWKREAYRKRRARA